MEQFSKLIIVTRLRLLATVFFFLGVILAYRSSFNEMDVNQTLLPALFFVLSFILVSLSLYFASKREA